MPAGRKSSQHRYNSTPVKNRSVPRSAAHEAAKMASPAASSPDRAIQTGSAAFNALMLAITTCQATLTTKIDHVQTETAPIRRDMDRFRDRVTEAERRVSEIEDTQRDHHAYIQALKLKVKHLENRAEDAENRNRRSNLRILGLPEGAEGADPVTFMEGLLPTLLPRATFSPHFSIERAHRMPVTRGPPGAPPRTFKFKLLYYRDRDTILRAARLQGELKFGDATLLIFPDYSVETQRRRKSFDQVRAMLRQKGVKYSMLFPARLRVQDGERVQFFTRGESTIFYILPRDAAAWAETFRP